MQNHFPASHLTNSQRANLKTLKFITSSILPRCIFNVTSTDLKEKLVKGP